MEAGTTRRELVKRGIGAAAAASGAMSAPSAAAAAPAQSESQALSYALQIEQLAVIAYRRAVATHVLRRPVRTQLRLLLDQELEHVRTLERSLAQIGAAITEPPPSIRSAQAALTRYGIHWNLTH